MMMLQHLADWPVFGDDTYVFKESNTDVASALHVPPELHENEQARKEAMAKVAQEFVNEGMQQRLVPIIVAHNRLSPRVFMMGLAASSRWNLPMFSCERWEFQPDALMEKLATMVHYRGGTQIQDGPFRRYESVVAQSVRVDEVTDTESEASRVVARGECPPQSRQPLRPIVGHLLGVFWTIEIGVPSLPYVPVHITRPKEQILLYQVLLPPDCDIVLPKEFCGRFVSFETLFEHQTPIISALPSLLSRFTFKPMVCKVLEPTVGGGTSAVKSVATTVMLDDEHQRLPPPMEPPSDTTDTESFRT